MSTFLECLTDIVGITKDDCPCLLEGLSTAEKNALLKSTSGLYTDNLEGGIHLKSLKNTDFCKNLAELAIGARSEAIQRTSDDVKLVINQNYAKSKNSYNGLIGSTQWNAPYTFSKRYGSLKLKPKHYGDTIIEIKKAHLGWSLGAQTIRLIVLQVPVGGNSGTKIFDEEITTIENQFASIEVNEVFPFAKDGQAMEYYVMYDTTGISGSPLNNTASCNCGTLEARLKENLEVTGAEFDDPNAVSNAGLNAMGYGIYLEAEVRCEVSNFICREHTNNDAVGITLAYSVLYKTGELLIEAVLQSTEINRYTMMHREYLWGKRNHFVKEYNSRIKYLGSIIDVTDTDCYICEDNRIVKRGILS